MMLLTLPAPAFAQTPYTDPGVRFSDEVQAKLDRKISLDLRDIHVIDVLKFLSTKAELNIVASQNINARVTLFLKEVSISNALEIILISTGLALQVKDNILYIMTEEEFTALFGEAYRDQRSVKIIQLKYTAADKVGQMLGSLKSAIGKIIIDVQTGTLVLIDTEDKIKLMEEMAAKVDLPTVERLLPTETAVFELSYNSAESLQPQAATLLTAGVGRIQFDAKTNRLFVIDFPHAIKRIRALVKAFDRKTRQVFIETKSIQVRLDNDYRMGIDWEWIINEGPEREKFRITNSGTFPISSSATQFGRIVVGQLSKEDITATIDLLHEFGETTTLASPQLAVEHNEEATILVGTREAYVTSTVSQAESTTTTSESITFIDVGVQLKVLPQINQDGFVSLRVNPEVSSVGRTLTTANDNEIPIVDTTRASTKVLVKDGHTVIMGGLIRDNAVKTVRKVPILGDIPVFGTLFRSVDDLTDKTELVIFLTPHIVEGDEPHPLVPTAAGKPFQSFRPFPEDALKKLGIQKAVMRRG